MGSDPRKLPGRVSTFGCNSYDVGYIAFQERGRDGEEEKEGEEERGGRRRTNRERETGQRGGGGDRSERVCVVCVCMCVCVRVRVRVRVREREREGEGEGDELTVHLKSLLVIPPDTTSKLLAASVALSERTASTMVHSDDSTFDGSNATSYALGGISATPDPGRVKSGGKALVKKFSPKTLPWEVWAFVRGG